MSEWFRETFDEEYLTLYSHRDEQEAEKTTQWLCKMLDLVADARILDAPCGGGRHARAFARRGFRVVAVDLSRDLLTHALSTHERPQNILFVQADLRALPVQSRMFDLVVNLFSSFGYFSSDAENHHALQELTRACRPGGWVVVDFLNAPQVRANLKPQTLRTTQEGWEIVERRWIAGDPPRIEKEAVIRMPSGHIRNVRESVRLFTPEELSQALSGAGVYHIRVFGNYDGTPYSDTSPRAIFVGQKG